LGAIINIKKIYFLDRAKQSLKPGFTPTHPNNFQTNFVDASLKTTLILFKFEINRNFYPFSSFNPSYNTMQIQQLCANHLQ
jgi:hypothetical protein